MNRKWVLFERNMYLRILLTLYSLSVSRVGRGRDQIYSIRLKVGRGGGRGLGEWVCACVNSNPFEFSRTLLVLRFQHKKFDTQCQGNLFSS